MNYTEIILGILSLTGVLGSGYLGYKLKNIDREDRKERKEIDNNIGITELNMKFMRDEITSLKNEIRESRERQKQYEEQLNALKGGILTLSLFGSDAPLAMWAKDMNGRRVFHNKEYESMTGHLLIHCAGLTDLQITNNKELSDAWCQNDDEVLKRGVYFMTVEPCAHKNSPDVLFKVLVIKWPTRINGQVLGTEGVAIRVDKIQKTFDNQ